MEVRRLYTDFIICSPLHVTIASFVVSVNALLLCIISFIGITLYSVWKKLYSLLSALIIAMLYTSFHLLEIYDPIWIVVDRVFLLSSALVYASVHCMGIAYTIMFSICRDVTRRAASDIYFRN